MTLRSAATAILLASLLTTPLVRAHDVVLVPEAKQLRLRYGHPQDWRPADKSKLVELLVLRGDAAALDVQERFEQRGLDLVSPRSRLGAPGPWLAAARYDNGLWAELPPVGDAPPQWRNATRLTVPKPRSTSASVKFAKTYAGHASDRITFRRTVGHLLEIVPQKNPLAVRAGETLPVLVTFGGQPLANAALEVRDLVTALDEDKIQRYSTGPDGIAQVPLRAKGVSMIGVDFQRPNDGSMGEAIQALPADKVSMVATYTVVR
jgi:uncharacterized GH25 family protein